MQKNTTEYTQKYLSNIAKTEIFTFDEEQSYFKRYNETKDEAEKSEIREIIIKHNLRLVAHVAAGYAKNGMELDECIQNGNVGLLTAIDKFEYERGYKFSTYATWWIRQAILRENANNGRVIRVPAHAVTNVGKIRKAIEELKIEFQDEDVVDASLIAEKTGLSESLVEDMLLYVQDVQSIDVPCGDHGEDRDATFAEIAEDTKEEHNVEGQLIAKERAALIKNALSVLTDKERTVIVMYHGLDDGTSKTLDEIGKELHVTRERIRQIKMIALNKLKAEYGAQLATYLHD